MFLLLLLNFRESLCPRKCSKLLNCESYIYNIFQNCSSPSVNAREIFQSFYLGKVKSTKCRNWPSTKVSVSEIFWNDVSTSKSQQHVFNFNLRKKEKSFLHHQTRQKNIKCISLPGTIDINNVIEVIVLISSVIKALFMWKKKWF